LEHPNITQYFDFREDNYNVYILQEFCIGGRVMPKIEELTEMTENMAADMIS
jgi:hypothetical protein